MAPGFRIFAFGEFRNDNMASAKFRNDRRAQLVTGERADQGASDRQVAGWGWPVRAEREDWIMTSSARFSAVM